MRDWLQRPLGRRGLSALATRSDLAILICVVTVYAVIRLVGLTRFPIYFFCDEATHTNLAVDLLRHGLRDEAGVLLPPYFRNVNKWNLSLSVYIHAISVWLFGTSLFINRATTVAVTLLAAVALATILRVTFRLRLWWTAENGTRTGSVGRL